MPADGRLGDDQFAGDRAVGPALRDQPRHLRLARGEALQRFTAATHPEPQRTTRLVLLLVLGIALLSTGISVGDCTGISVADTIVMATSDRARDLAPPRPAGATRWQVLRLTAAEALTVVAAGALLGLLVAAVDLACMAGPLARLSAPATIELPWQALGTTTAVRALLGTTTAVRALLATASALGLCRRPAELAGARD